MPNPLLCAGVVAMLVFATLFATLIARRGFPLPPPDRRIGCVDGLRGYLALSVMAHHFVIWFGIAHFHKPWALPDLPFFQNMGPAGVSMFFMTTGLVFYPRVIAGLRKTSWLSVYISRFFRIIPLIIFSVVVVGAIGLYRMKGLSNGPWLLPSLMWISSYAQPDILGYPDTAALNARVLWSLWFEWLFYLAVLPIMALAADGLRLFMPRWFLPTATVALFIGYRIWVPIAGLAFFVPLFAAGMVAFEVQSRSDLRIILQKRWVSVAAIVVLISSMLVVPNYNALIQFASYSFFFVCVASGNTMFGALKTRGALVLGECAFSIYLLHGVVLDILFTEGLRMQRSMPDLALPFVLIIIAGIVTCITAVTYLTIERPAIALGRKLSTRLTGRRPRADDPELEIAP